MLKRFEQFQRETVIIKIPVIKFILFVNHYFPKSVCRLCISFLDLRTHRNIELTLDEVPSKQDTLQLAQHGVLLSRMVRSAVLDEDPNEQDRKCRLCVQTEYVQYVSSAGQIYFQMLNEILTTEQTDQLELNEFHQAGWIDDQC